MILICVENKYHKETNGNSLEEYFMEMLRLIPMGSVIAINNVGCCSSQWKSAIIFKEKTWYKIAVEWNNVNRKRDKIKKTDEIPKHCQAIAFGY